MTVDTAYAIAYNVYMKTVTTTQARKELYQLVDDTNENHVSIQILGKRGNAVLVSEEDWNSVQETLHLLSVPGMRESLVEGAKIPLEKCVTDLDW